MNYPRFLVSITLAAMIFVVMFLAQQSQYVFLNSLMDPFKDTQDLNGIEYKANEPIITLDGEIFTHYPSTKMDSLDKRILKDGALFASGVLMKQKDIDTFLKQSGSVWQIEEGGFDPAFFGLNPEDLSKENLDILLRGSLNPSNQVGDLEDTSLRKNQGTEDIVSMFTFEGKELRVGEVQVGNLLIRYPLSSVFIQRDEEQMKTSIHAYGGSVELLFEGAVRPFVLPSHNKVTIYDRLLNEKTGQLYYTKLQKDFRMQRFNVLGAQEDQEEAVTFLLDAWEYQTEKEKEIRSYAKVSHEKLIPGTLHLGSSMEWLRDIQQRFGVGYPERKKDIVRFESTIRPLFESIVSIRLQGLQTNSLQRLSGIQYEVSSPDWETLIKNNSELSSRWSSFEHSHQVAARMSLGNDPVASFYGFWSKTDVIDTFGDLQLLFLDSQLQLSMGQKLKARDFLLQVKNALEQLQLNEQNSADTTDMRRVLIQMIKRSSFLQSREVFEVYQAFVQSEMDIYDPKDELTRELRLEIARDSLYFLNKYIESGTNLDGAQILMDVYAEMKVDAITGKLQRKIFTNEETEVITFIQLLGTSNITKEKIEAVKEVQKTADEFEKIIEEELFTLPEVEEVEEVVLPKGYIQDSTHLKEFFEELDLNLYKFTSTLKEEEGLIVFSGVNYKGFSISGSFLISNQVFDALKAGSIQKVNIRKRYFERFLLSLEEKAAPKKEEVEEPVFVWGNGISQNDRLTLQRKQFIVELMKRTAITTTIKDVVSISKDRTFYRILNAKIEGLSTSIGFSYDVRTKSLSQIVFHAGGTENQLDTSFDLEGAVESIISEIEALLSPSEDDEV